MTSENTLSIAEQLRLKSMLRQVQLIVQAPSNHGVEVYCLQIKPS